jgi:DNA-3-methyladenine glycosylase I
MKRCDWCTDDPLYLQYHDQEWGVPVKNDRKLFEMLVLEGMQAGLSWITVLRKRENYRELFDKFDPLKISSLSDKELNKLLLNPGIIRNRLKVYAIRKNAQAFLEVQHEFKKFSHYLWRFVENTPKQNRWRTLKEIPTSTVESDALSKDLKKRGFTFVGSTICYAYMQAIGMVNDHVTSCFRYKECGGK